MSISNCCLIVRLLSQSIRSKKDFGNPYLLQKVVEHYDIQQVRFNISFCFSIF